MSLDDDAKSPSAQEADQLARLYRNRERVLALLLSFLALGASAVYFIMLRDRGWLLLSVMIASEFMVVVSIYIVIVKRWRRNRRT
jgi:hypothetical protein